MKNVNLLISFIPIQLKHNTYIYVCAYTYVYLYIYVQLHTHFCDWTFQQSDFLKQVFFVRKLIF